MRHLAVLFPKLKPRNQYPYEKHYSLGTVAERPFFITLNQAVDGQYRIFAMVRVADVLKLDNCVSRKDFWKYFDKITSKHFDFVLVDHENWNIKAAMELDDASHRQRNRQARDAFLNAARENARLPLIRITVSQKYDVNDIRNLIISSIS